MARSKGWALRTYSRKRGRGEQEIRIVYPRGDSRRHLTHPNTTIECWCEPSVERHRRGRILVGHNSEDGRELVEQHGIN